MSRLPKNFGSPRSPHVYYAKQIGFSYHLAREEKNLENQYIWDKKQRYKWDRQPITSEQISLIHKLAPDYKIDTKKMTRGDASRVIQLLAYAPKEQDAQEQAQEVQDDAT